MKRLILLSPIVLGLIMFEVTNYLESNELYHILISVILTPISLFSASHEITSKQVEISNVGKLFLYIIISAIPVIMVTEFIPSFISNINLTLTMLTALTYLTFFLLVLVYFRERHQKTNSELDKALF